MTYRVLTNSRRIEKDFLRIITLFSKEGLSPQGGTLYGVNDLSP